MVRAVIKYFYFKGLTPQEIFTDMKETLGESAPAYSTVTKWYAEFKRGRSSIRHVKTRNAVDDHQLLSMKKLLKKLTNSS